MKARCQTPSATSYANYGGRGISICPEWQTFVGFLDWALSSGYDHARRVEIDRIDPGRAYEPANCRWVSKRLNVQRARLGSAAPPPASLEGKLTDLDIAAPRDRLPAKLFDGASLFLHITASGSTVWRFKFTLNKRERLLTIGRYPRVTIAEAREAAAIARGHLRAGRDPARMKAETKARRRRGE